MKRPGILAALRILLTLGCVAYPLAAYSAGYRVHPPWLAAGLSWGPLALLAAWLIGRSRLRLWLALAAALVLALLWRERALVAQHLAWAYLVEHAGSMTLLGIMFGGTLRGGQVPLVTRFAATIRPSMSAALLRYTRGVTVAWTLFFVAMAVASVLLFALRPLAEWALFAGAWTPVLVFLMFAVEYALRHALLCPADRSGPYEALRAYMLYAAERRR